VAHRFFVGKQDEMYLLAKILSLRKTKGLEGVDRCEVLSKKGKAASCLRWFLVLLGGGRRGNRTKILRE